MKSIWKIILRIIFTIITINSAYLNAQQIPVKATSSIDSNQVLIGDQIQLKLKIELQKDVKLNFPNLTDSIGRLIILNKSKIDTNKKEKNLIFSQNLLLTMFDSGSYQIPPIEFKYSIGNDSAINSVFTNELYIKFLTLPVDTTKPIKDIKPPLNVPFSIWDIIWYIVIPLMIIGLGLIAFFFINKRKPKVKEIQKFDPKIPAHIQALSDLEKLEEEKLWQNFKVKEYHTILSEILRLYLERRFEFPALEMTTSEIMDNISKMLSGSEILLNLRFILELADLVKFAKNIPYPEENIRAMDLAKDIVKNTIPIEIEESGAKDGKN